MSTSKIARFLRDFHGALNLCNCAIFNYKGSKFIYRTSDGKKGKAFGNFSRTYLSSLGLPPTSYIKDFNDVPVENLVFLTATSWNHYKESLAGVASVLEYFPKNKIMYYDLGLKKEQANEVSCLKYRLMVEPPLLLLYRCRYIRPTTNSFVFKRKKLSYKILFKEEA